MTGWLPDSREAHRLVPLDALRAIAALLVMVTHATESIAYAAGEAARATFLYRIAHAADFGRIGVIVFFMISGYVVAATLSDPRTTVRTFLVRRFFRLYPLYWTSIVLACVLLRGTYVDGPTLAANATMLPSLFGREPYLGLYWTLETELVFYLVAVGLWHAGLLRAPRFLAAAIAALVALFAAFMFGALPAPANLSWKSFPLNLAFMLCGVLLQVRDRDGARGPWLGAALAIVLAPSAYVFVRYLQAGSPDDLRWAVAYPAAVALFVVLFHARRLPLAALASAGMVSYSIYLLHPFALLLIDREVVSGARLFAQAGMAVSVALSVAATLVLAYASYHLVEAPFNRFARRITREGARPAGNRFVVR